MSRPGLSYDQAPPLAAPLYLYLAAPLFLMLAVTAGLFLVFQWPAGRWVPATLALTHLVTLGFLGSVMFGSLLQILPVVLGVRVRAAVAVAKLGLIGLSMGTPALAWGMLSGNGAWLATGSITLTLGLLPLLATIGYGLSRSVTLAWVAWPLREAGIALVVTLGLGLGLVAMLNGVNAPVQLPALVDVHAAWGLAGWVLILVMGVAYQVVPMLQITPPYPASLVHVATWIVLAALFLYTLAQLDPWEGQGVLSWSARLAGPVAAVWFAAATLQIQARRRRRLPDVTLDFWRLGMAGLILAALALPALAFIPEDWQEPVQLSLGMAFLIGFAMSVVMGMLYKIVPFLAWFHLQAQTGAKAGTIPNMKEMIPDEVARRHFRLHMAAVLLLLPTPFLPAPAAVPGLLALGAGAQMLWLNLLQARRLFLDHGGRLTGSRGPHHGRSPRSGASG
jgi:hypothetical protein